MSVHHFFNMYGNGGSVEREMGRLRGGRYRDIGTDVLIWIQRGNGKAARAVDRSADRHISIITYMELVQSATNKKQFQFISGFLKDFGFQTLPLTESIGHRAAVYVEEYSLSHGIRAVEAIIAATATENHLPLCSGNAKHFKAIEGLQFKIFRP